MIISKSTDLNHTSLHSVKRYKSSKFLLAWNSWADGRLQPRTFRAQAALCLKTNSYCVIVSLAPAWAWRLSLLPLTTKTQQNTGLLQHSSSKSWRAASPPIQLTQAERQLQVLIGGQKSFDMSVAAVHDYVCRYLPELWLHREAIHPHSSLVLTEERLYNVNTPMCYKTYAMLAKHLHSPFSASLWIGLKAQGGLLGV